MARARVVVAERALAERDQSLGKSTNSGCGAKVAKGARRAPLPVTANASERIGMDGDTEVTEILQRARDGTSKDKDGRRELRGLCGPLRFVRSTSSTS